MRLPCEVSVSSRLLPSAGLRGPGRAARALLSLGAPAGGAAASGGGDGVWLLVSTPRDRPGTKYQLKENIEQLFTKFVEEGKATIRLKEPAVDVCLSKANARLLKTFLSALKLAHSGAHEGALPALVPPKASEVEKPKTRMTVMSRKEYPLTQNFPYSLEHLQVSYCKLARVDMRMLCLKNLRKLDLSHNCIQKLPATVGDLACLQELSLHNNHLEAFSTGLCSSTLQKSLLSLDLSQNRIKALPAQFCQLQALTHLRLDDNQLVRLPFKIGRLRQLRSLSAARNKLPFLPGDFARLSLDHLDLFGNPFERPQPLVPCIQLKIPLTLLECSARAVVNFRIPYGRHVLPSDLCEDLDVSKTCQCGSACLSSFIQITVTMNLHSVAHTVVLVDNMGSTEAPTVLYFCSLTCYSRFLDRHPQAGL